MDNIIIALICGVVQISIIIGMVKNIKGDKK